MHLAPLDHRRPARAFTLIEVILAIVIALGIMMVALYFYQQATDLRSQVLTETERVASARLLMDRITGELRGALPDWSVGPAFLGGSNNIQFIKADVPAYSTWNGGALGRSSAPLTDLKRIRYRLESVDGTNTAGVVRSEEPLVNRRELVDPGSQPGQTNNVAGAASPPVLEEIRFLQFRYWSGTNWVDAWTGDGCPAGVEVSLGSEPATNGMDLAEYPGDLFRRVIFLTANHLSEKPASASDVEKTSSSEETQP
jgi:type II secretory pathway pseudopilin PulG